MGPGDFTEVSAETNRRAELAFAIAHEVGNHLGGIRLHAHLLDEDLDARSLAEASVSIDLLAGRSGPLLSLLRPLLSEERGVAGDAKEITWSGLIGRVTQQVEDQGTGGVGFEVQLDLAPTESTPDFDWLYPLLIAILDATFAETARNGSVRLKLYKDEGRLTLEVEDDAPEEDVSAAAAPRGRPLTLALARELLSRIGGDVEAYRVGASTHVRLQFPT